MQPSAVLHQPASEAEWARARQLVEEYGSRLGIDLSFQGFAREVERLPEEYGPPAGAFLLAAANGVDVGCVGLRRLSAGVGEVKRLYVAPDARGKGLGKQLVEGIIEAAARIGYSRLRLDTLPTMKEAQGLYLAIGFRPVAPYRPNPIPGASFMEMELRRGGHPSAGGGAEPVPAPTGAAAPQEPPKRTALLVIDVQNDYFPGGAMELAGAEAAGANVGRLLAAFRSRELPVVHVRHESLHAGATFFLPGTAGARIHESARPAPREPLVLKHFPNGFRETDLLERLRGLEVGRLVIAGMMTHMCVDTTTRAASDLGFECVLAHDACATRTLSFDGVTVPAEHVQAAYVAALGAAFASARRTSEIEGERP